MRTSPITALFPGVRGQVLGALFLDPDRSWYLSDLARHLGLPSSSLQRDIERLTRAGILRRRKDGNRVYFEPDPDCPFLPELAALFAKTSGVVPRLRAALEPMAKDLVAAFIYGSTARAEDRASSDVDLLLVGKVTLRRLSPALRRLQLALGREIHPTVYAPAEFATKLRERDPFLQSVLAKEKVFVVGTEDDLGRASDSATRRPRVLQQGGTR